MYNVAAIKKAMGKKRLAKVKDWDCYGSDPMTFDILMLENWWYDGDGTLIILEAYPDEDSQAEVIRILKDRIDEFEYRVCDTFTHGDKTAFQFSA
tara:strand:- start:1956 stop:2240 length:285 start_codon:yes stop_codon:yes gene_type:complete